MTEEIQKNFNAAHEKVVSVIADYVAGGYTETLAKLLVYIGKDKAEETLAKLPEPVQSQVREAYKKLSNMKPVNPEIMASAMRVLKDAQFYGKPLCDEVATDLSSDNKNELINSTDELYDQDPLISLSVEKHLLTFDVITRLDDRAIQKMLREVDQMELAKSLKGADEEIQKKIFRNMSKRAANMLQEDMEFMGPVRLADVNEARDEIIKIILNLEANGDIVISSYWDGNSLVY